MAKGQKTYKTPDQQATDQEIGSYLQSSPAWKQMQDQMQSIQMMQSQLPGQLEKGASPGTILTTPDQWELQAGITPPAYEGVRDPVTGQLLSQYTLDPYSGKAEQALSQQAFSQGLTPQAQNLMQQEQLQEQNARAAAQQQGMTATDQGMSNLARTGGLTSGAAALLQNQGARNNLMANQGISNQGMQSRLGIQQNDINQKNQMLGQFAQNEQQAGQSNIATSMQDIAQKAAFNSNRYNQQMQAWAAGQSADATRAAGSGGKK